MLRPRRRREIPASFLRSHARQPSGGAESGRPVHPQGLGEGAHADARFGDRPNGAFTYLFLKALAADPAQTRAQLHSTITKGLKSEDFEQRSTLEGPAKAKKVAFGQPW